MKIAISTDDGQVAAHFGRCPEFSIVTLYNGAIKQTDVVRNPGHEPGKIPAFLKEKGVECIIAGGMGRRAQLLFEQYGIQYILGVTGQIETVIQQISADTLKGGESLCSPGAGKGHGIEKVECDH